MEPADIAAVIAGSLGAARLAAEADVDGVEVNAGQHSLLRQFLSGLTNHRADEWGDRPSAVGSRGAGRRPGGRRR